MRLDAIARSARLSRRPRLTRIPDLGYPVTIMKKWVLALVASISALLFAQGTVDEVTDARMRSEELEHSKIMHTLHMLTDRYGPRVTGTPNHEAAAKWAMAEMT